MAQQVDGVLDSAGTFERTGVDRHAQRLGQLLEVERPRLPRELDGALQQPAVHLGPD
jgi:hypothetical protein